jgi:hypothetical protein
MLAVVDVRDGESMPHLLDQSAMQSENIFFVLRFYLDLIACWVPSRNSKVSKATPEVFSLAVA